MSNEKPLDGLYTSIETTTYRGYNTDTEESDSWSETEYACLHFSPDGDVRAAIGDENSLGFDTDSAYQSTLLRVPNAKPVGQWQRATRQGHDGYAVEKELPFGAPGFWGCSWKKTEVFLEWQDGDKLMARRFHGNVSWEDGEVYQTRVLTQVI
jgi:hypothetical protein